MNPQDISALTVYNDLYTVLIEKGYTQEEATETFMKLTAQAEVEVVEELMDRLTVEQQQLLDSLPDNTPPDEVAAKLGLEGTEVDEIRARKTAELISKIASEIDKDDPEIVLQQAPA